MITAIGSDVNKKALSFVNYKFKIENSGNYYIWFLGEFPRGKKPFGSKINGQTLNSDVPLVESNKLHWIKLQSAFPFKEGEHDIRVGALQTGSKLQRIAITKSPKLPKFKKSKRAR